MRNMENEQGSDKKNIAIVMAVSIFGAFLICLALVLLASALVLNGTLPESFMMTFTTVVTFLATLAGAWYAARRLKARMLLVGAAEGVGFFLFLLLIGGIFYQRFVPQGGALPLFLACLAGGMLGGFLAAGRKKSGKHAAVRK